MSHFWRWRLWIQANDSPPIERPKVVIHSSWLVPAFAFLRKNPGATPFRLMLHMRIGYRKAEHLIEEFNRVETV